jgi:hypothetical protein
MPGWYRTHQEQHTRDTRQMYDAPPQLEVTVTWVADVVDNRTGQLSRFTFDHDPTTQEVRAAAAADDDWKVLP